ncbi:MAG: MBL fold metallo-hydrolase RNA specificity domain-containing protein [Halodesulfurarchaeum sp.]
MTVRVSDGIEIHLSDGRRIVADATVPDGDVNLLSHAHGDHLYREVPAEVVASPLTLALAAARRPGQTRPDSTDPPSVTTIDAGHVPGSRAFLIEGKRRYLYTGDCSIRDRFYLSGFDPPSADVLILESTYGAQGYEFPAQRRVEEQIREWLTETRDRPVLLFGYALGRAQELEVLATSAGRDRVFVTDAIARLDAVIESHLDVDLPGAEYDGDVELGAGDALVLPSQTTNLSFVEGLRDAGALAAGFTGWAVDDSYRFARDLDAAFPLSDHCDHEELLSVVDTVEPEQVYTVHGFVDELATRIESELGVSAQSLKANQSTLGEF